MPEYIMPTDHAKDMPSFDRLPAFVQGYLEAAFFTEHNERYDRDEWDSEEAQEAVREGTVSGSIPKDAGYADMTEAVLTEVMEDCKAFEEYAADLLAMAYGDDGHPDRGYDEAQAGRDFWYTRNGHGVGFWDRKELTEGGLGDRLAKRARKQGNVDAYWGDDGKVYFS